LFGNGAIIHDFKRCPKPAACREAAFLQAFASRIFTPDPDSDFMLAYRHLFSCRQFRRCFQAFAALPPGVAFEKKDKPFFVLDTHAGIGRYDLTHEWALKNAEFRDASRWSGDEKTCPTNSFLLRCDQRREQTGECASIPFNAHRPPAVAAVDRMVLVELNRKDCETGILFGGDRQTTVHLMDDIRRSKLPAAERAARADLHRFVVRPSREFDRLTEGLVEATGASPTAFTRCVSVDGAAGMRAFERGLVETASARFCNSNCPCFRKAIARDAWMRDGGGDPPFGFEQETRSMLKWLQPVLSREDGGSQRVVGGGGIEAATGEPRQL